MKIKKLLKVRYEAYHWLLKSEIFDFLPSMPAKGDTINIPILFMLWIDGEDLVATWNWKYEDGVFIFEIE